MTFAQTIAAGQATGLSFRLRIEGIRDDFVSHPAMIMTTPDASGRTRRVGLDVSGIKISQKADLANCTIEASGITFKIADVGGYATAAFSTEPAETWMAPGTLNASDTTLVVASTTGFDSPSGYLWIDSEAMTYSGVGTTVVDGVTRGTFTGLTRGVLETLAQYHYSADVGSSDTQLRFPSVTNGPATIAGRRVYLYLYNRGDDPQGDGEQKWIGIASRDPRCTGAVWSLSANSIADILNAEVGTDLGSCSPRGIKYPMTAEGAPTFHLLVYRVPYDGHPDGTLIPYGRDDGTGEYVPASFKIVFPSDTHDGFFETQQDFIDEVQAQLDVGTAGWGTTIAINEDLATGTYYFDLYPSATPDGVLVAINYATLGQIPSPADAVFDSVVDLTGEQRGRQPSAPSRQYPNGGIEGGSTVPRGVLAPGPRIPTLTADQIRDATVYLDGTIVPSSDMTAVQVETGDDTADRLVYSTDAVNRSITLTTEGSERGEYPYTSASLPTLTLGREIRITLPGAISVWGTYDLLKGLEFNCPQYVNLGITPVIRSTDWTGEGLGDPGVETGWLSKYIDPTAPLFERRAPALAANRKYLVFKPTKLLDLITPDLQLMGAYLAFDTTGRLTIERIRTALVSEVPVLRISDRRNLIGDDGPPSWEKKPFGSTNTYVVQEGYDPKEDKWTATPIATRNLKSLGRDPSAKALQVKPKSVFTGSTGGAIDRGLVDAAAARVLTVFGAPYIVVPCTVPLTGFDTILGSVVSLSSALLPSGNGARGADCKGIVISREIDILGGRIELQVLVTLSSYAGYVPSAMIDSEAFVSGTTWEITLNADYFRAGDVAADHFVAGDNVAVYPFDSDTATPVYGTVASGSSGNVVRVAFLSAWTPTGEDVLAFSDAGPETDSMKQYGYAADTDFRIAWTAPERAAFKFSVL